jgi:hypothetical protein
MRRAGRHLHDAGEQVDCLVVVSERRARIGRQLGCERQLHEVGAGIDLGLRVHQILQPGGVIEQLPDRDRPLPALTPLGIEIGHRLIDGADLLGVDEPADGQVDDRLGGGHRLDRALRRSEVPLADQRAILVDDDRVGAGLLGARQQPGQRALVDARIGVGRRTGGEEGYCRGHKNGHGRRAQA